MQCASCGNCHTEGRKFCARCGALFGAQCQWCGISNRAGETVCRGCRASLAAIRASGTSRPDCAEPQDFDAGRYHVISPISVRGNQRSYVAHDTRLGLKLRALVMDSSGLGEVARARVMRMARAAAQLNGHPHISTVYEIGDENGWAFVIGEYCKDGSLEDLLSRTVSHRLELTEALRIGTEICGALDHARSSGIVHGGLSPSCVMMAPGRVARLADFGLGNSLAIELTRLTGDAVPIGDVSYLAPEQLSGEPPQPESDLYSLGLILYEMVTGRRPLTDNQLGHPLARRLGAEPDPSSVSMPYAPAALQTLIWKLLRRVPEEGPQTAASVADSLREISGWFQTPPALAAQLSPAAALEPVQAIQPAERPHRPEMVRWAWNLESLVVPVPLAVAIVGLVTLLSAGLILMHVGRISARRAQTEAREGGPRVAIASVNRPAVPGRIASIFNDQGSRPGGSEDGPKAHPQEELIELANEGNPGAQAALGNMYLRGDGAARDYTEALRWLREAASHGNAEAQADLGYLYAVGEGAQQNYTEAAEWFLKAAAQNHPEAQYDLALMYEQGQGVPKSKAEALKWLRRAAARENARAQYELGRRYLTGDGVAEDDSRAVQWLQKAAGQGSVEAQNALGYIYEQGRGSAQDFAQALHWYRMAADQGDAKAQLNLGIMYENGEGVAPDFAQAARWYRMAGEQGEPYAQTSIGVLYCKGEGEPRDYSKALDWFMRAASMGEPKAEYNLGVMYDSGLGVKHNYAEAARWYLKAAAQGHIDAQYNLGYLYEHGQGVARNNAEALEWYRKAAGQGDSTAIAKVRLLESR